VKKLEDGAVLHTGYNNQNSTISAKAGLTAFQCCLI
jgi:hypothetical protein